jgi:hypothetical protein
MATVPAATAGGLTPGAGCGQSASPQAIERVMETHFRSTVAGPSADYSPAWRDAKLSMRLLNHMSPLMLGIIQRPGSDADLGQRKEALKFMLGSADALARVMSEQLALTPVTKEYDRIELNSMLTHIIGRIWQGATAENQQQQVDDLLRTVAGVFSDAQFLSKQEGRAHLMMNKVGYLRVDSEETMATRLRVSMHQVALRFFEAITDERLGNGRGANFTFGKKKPEVLVAMLADFDHVVESVLLNHEFSSSLSNDQRTGVMQAWIRQASEIYRAEYVARTLRVIEWFRAGQSVSKDEYSSRFVKASGMLGEVLDKVSAVTTETMTDLITVAGFDIRPGTPDEVELMSNAVR